MAGLRVIAGSARGRRLRRVPGEATRPITDRVKESLFNILGADIEGASMLDLFAGTGSVGIEALSRGAGRVVFVDIHSAAIATIQSNLELTQLEEGAEIVRGDAFTLLSGRLHESFDYIFVAPPQYQGLVPRVIAAIDARPDCVNPDGWVIAQLDPKEPMQLNLSSLVEIDRRRYGNTLLVFFERPGI
jgi:16S rRNA (guanine(966)-N(2))-methyltransferase RsmD